MEKNRRKAVVTGASRGIGKAIALALAKEDIEVILIARNAESLEEVRKEIINNSGLAHAYQLDITDEKRVLEVINEISNCHGQIDILVNCAGIGVFTSITEMNSDMLNKCLQVNLVGTFMITREIAKLMKKQNKGQIINIESIASTKAFELGGAYVASKFGLAGFTQVLWEELKKYEIKVCAIRPGLVNTDFISMEKSKYPVEKALNVEDIAYTAVCVVNQGKNSNISEIVIRPIKKEAQNLFGKIIKENYCNGVEKY